MLETNVHRNFLIACENGDLGTVRKNINNVDINLSSSNKHTGLHFSAALNHKDIVSILIEHGVNLDSVDNHGDTALMAAAYAQNIEIMELLIISGANLDICDNSGETCLMHMARLGYVNSVKLLIDGGANLEIKNHNGQNALIISSFAGRSDVVNLLINNVSDIEIKDNYGDTALISACKNKSEPWAFALIENGADFNVENGVSAYTLIMQNEMLSLRLQALFEKLSLQHYGESLFASACFGHPSPIKPQITRRLGQRHVFRRLRSSCSNIVQSTTGWPEHRSNDSTRSLAVPRRYLHFHSARGAALLRENTSAIAIRRAKNLHSAQKLRFQDFSAVDDKDVVLGL